MNTPQNIGEAFLAAAARWPEKNAIIAEDFAITYGNLARVVTRFALRFQNEGVGRGSVVGIDTGDAIVMTSSIFALSILGAAFTTVGPEFSEKDPIGLTHAFRTEDRPGPATMTAQLFDDSYSPKAPYFSLEPLRKDGFQLFSDRAWILCSSGTTGNPKAVEISASLLWRRVAVASEDYGSSTAALCLIFRPFARPYPLRAVAALLNGTPLVDSQTPQFLLEHGVDLVCASKKQAHEWLDANLPFTKRLSRIQVSGARLFPEDLMRFSQGFEIVEDVYGSNETIAAEITEHRHMGGDIMTTRRNPQSEVEVVDPSGRVCPPGQTGTIRIRNSLMAPGYVNRPEETAKRFRDGWFYPGDMAIRDENGVLQVLGREDDVANIGGIKFHMADIDQALSGGGPLTATCFVTPPLFGDSAEELAAMIVVETGMAIKETVTSAWSRCAQKYGVRCAPRRILSANSLPLAADGTPKRSAARDIFLERVAAMDQADLSANLFHFNPQEHE